MHGAALDRRYAGAGSAAFMQQDHAAGPQIPRVSRPLPSCQATGSSKHARGEPQQRSAQLVERWTTSDASAGRETAATRKPHVVQRDSYSREREQGKAEKSTASSAAARPQGLRPDRQARTAQRCGV